MRLCEYVTIGLGRLISNVCVTELGKLLEKAGRLAKTILYQEVVVFRGVV